MNTVSEETGPPFKACLDAIRKMHEVFLKENPTPAAIFDAIRLYMVVAAAFLEQNLRGTDEEMRAVLHSMLDLGINDYQFNERARVGSKEGS